MNLPFQPVEGSGILQKGKKTHFIISFIIDKKLCEIRIKKKPKTTMILTMKMFPPQEKVN